MTRWWLLTVALFGGCVCAPDHLTDDAYATAQPYGAEINACITRHHCDVLCDELFVLQPDQTMTACKIEHVDAQGTALVRMFYDDNAVCAADTGGDIYIDDSGDDGSTDTGDDGSTDDGSDDGSTDGSSDDGSTDDGSTDDGSTDDGSTDTGDDGSTDPSERLAPRGTHRTPVSPARR